MDISKTSLTVYFLLHSFLLFVSTVTGGGAGGGGGGGKVGGSRGDGIDGGQGE